MSGVIYAERANQVHLRVAGLLGMMAAARAQAPAWWTNRNVIATNAMPHDYAAVNQGQVKWLAAQAPVSRR